MKHFLGAALLSTTAMVALAGSAMAAGTAANTSIDNTISLSYDTAAGQVTVPNASTVTFLVDRKVDLGFDGNDASYNVTANQGEPVILEWVLENQGNDASGYDIDVNQSGPLGLTFDPTGSGAEGTWSLYIGTVSGEDAGDTLYDPSGVNNIGDVDADGVRYVKIYAYVPANAANGNSDTFLVISTALEAGTNTVQTASGSGDLATLDTVLADEGLNDGANNGTERATETLTVTAPELSASKTVAVIDDNLNGSFDCGATATGAGGNAVPGACLEYTITVTNSDTAGAAATGITITDVLDAALNFEAIRDNSGFDTVQESGGTVTGEIATLPVDSSATFKIRASVK